MRIETRIIETHDFALVVKGDSLPIDDLKHITERADSLGFDLVAAGASSALGARLVVTNKEKMPDLTAYCETEARKRADGDRVLEWLHGADTGTSSRVIVSVLADGIARQRATENHPSPPWDPDDFGRCYRLLGLFPEWRERLGEVAAAHPRWRLLVANWAELEELYREEEPKLYDRMKSLEEELESS